MLFLLLFLVTPETEVSYASSSLDRGNHEWSPSSMVGLFFQNFEIDICKFPEIGIKMLEVDNIGIYHRAKYQSKICCITV